MQNKDTLKQKDTKKNDAWLFDIREANKRKAAQKKIAHGMFNEELREPDAVLEIDEHYTYGLWRIPEGVIKIRKFKNGYHLSSWRAYPNIELAKLRTVMDSEPEELSRR